LQEAMKNPKVAAAYADVKANPMSFMKYLGDPDIVPIIQKASRRSPVLRCTSPPFDASGWAR
jgi:hypothetical protein